MVNEHIRVEATFHLNACVSHINFAVEQLSVPVPTIGAQQIASPAYIELTVIPSQ